MITTIISTSRRSGGSPTPSPSLVVPRVKPWLEERYHEVVELDWSESSGEGLEIVCAPPARLGRHCHRLGQRLWPPGCVRSKRFYFGGDSASSHSR